jgi:hypothetical protein
MLEDSMSVWPGEQACRASLEGSEGTLVCVSISVDPRYLESLLEALALVDFPINPQIYHDAAWIYRYADGHEELESTTLVEFPAYAERLDEVRRSLEAHGFDPATIQVVSMLEEIHAECAPEPAPTGAPYISRRRVKRRAATAAH